MALALIALCFVLATLTPLHFLPIPTFYQEIVVGAGMVLAALIVLASGGLRAGWSVPWASLGAMALVVVLLLGLRAHPNSSVDYIVWPVGALLISSMAAWFGHRIALAGQAEWLVNALLAAFAFAAIGTAIVLWAQLLFPNQQEIWLFPRQALQPPSGNVGQRNQSGLLLGFGLLAFAYWSRSGVSRAEAKRAAAVLGMLLLVSGMTLTQSRIAFGFLFVAGLSLGALWSRPNRRWRGALLGLVALAVMYATLQWLIYTGFGLEQLFPPATQRLADRGIGQRLGLLHVAWAEFTAHPIWGGGFASFSDWEFRLGLQQAQPLYATNAHNLFAQIGAEWGLVGLLALFIPGGISLWRMLQQLWRTGLAQWPAWTIPAVGVCSMLLGYSLTEFPLWYMYFLVPFALCWGMLDSTAVHLRVTRSAQVLLGLVTVLMLAFMAWASIRYLDFVKLTALATDNALYEKNQGIFQRNLQKVTVSPGFSPIVEALNFYSMGVDPFMLSDKIALGRRVAGSYTGVWFLQKLGMLYALDHRPKDAALTLAKACAFYPDDCPDVRSGLQRLQTLAPKIYDPVSAVFYTLAQSKIQPVGVNVLKPWEHGASGTVVTIDPKKTLFGFDLALYASGLAQQGWKGGSFVAQPSAVSAISGASGAAEK
ncbi:PglL family O-oligosaccharyltransferase [Thiomonas sp. X19]|uniref:PglL family O-oligosaccharyltransferase n=1 Tax=Thiomonas sp. X19 TaxID=1050370 RepID=UPI000DDA8DF7|nr:O-antigen ligase family protein [Thiomonas sp. X19]